VNREATGYNQEKSIYDIMSRKNMNRNQASKPLWVLMIMTVLACNILSVPFDQATQTATVPVSISFTETAQSPVLTLIPTTTPALTPTAIPEKPTLHPTDTLFPEEQLYTVVDQTGAIQVNIPTTWTDTRTEPWLDEKSETIGTTFLASTDIDAFLKLRAEGVAVSVSQHLPVGYAQLLESEYDHYVKDCEDTYKTRWPLDHPIYKGFYYVFGECNGVRDTWLSLFTAVDKHDPGKYIARVVAYDMIPIYGDTFRDIIMNFEIFPENIP